MGISKENVILLSGKHIHMTAHIFTASRYKSCATKNVLYSYSDEQNPLSQPEFLKHKH